MKQFLKSERSQGNCPYCERPARGFLSGYDINRRITEEIFHLNKCTNCGLIYIANPPENLSQYYTSDYYGLPKSKSELIPHLGSQEFKLDILKSFARGSDLLEIGPAIGMFCLLAKNAGFNVSAAELDADCVHFLNDQIGVRAVQSDDPGATVRAEDIAYDAICLWHVIEHLDKPWRTLDACVEYLKPGGILIIAAPNPDAWQAKLLGKNWPHYDLPRHLYELSIPWLQAYAARKRLAVELVTTCDEGSTYWSHFTWAMLLKRLNPFKRREGRAWKWGMRLGRLLHVLERQEGRGAAYTIVLRRSL